MVSSRTAEMMPPGSLEQVVFRMDALHRLQALGIRVLNPPRAVETAVCLGIADARAEPRNLRRVRHR